MKPAARVGDMHTCPLVNGTVPHVGGPVLPPAATTVLIAGMPAARAGDRAVCVGPPDTIARGSAGVFIQGRPAARLGDPTVHGGVIVAGCPTVLIGEICGGGAGSLQARTMSAAKKVGAAFTRMKCDGQVAADLAASPTRGPIIRAGVRRGRGTAARGKVEGQMGRLEAGVSSAVGGASGKLDVLRGAAEVKGVVGPQGGWLRGSGEAQVLKGSARVYVGRESSNPLVEASAAGELVSVEADLEFLVGSDERRSERIARAGVGARLARLETSVSGVGGGVSSKLDVLHGAVEMEDVAGPWGRSFQISAEAQVVKASARRFVGREPNNPIWAANAEGKLGSAEVDAEFLLGSDGRRSGIIARGSASASLASGEAGLERNISIPFTNWSVSLRAKASGEVGGGGIGGGGHAFVDHRTKRFHLGASGKVSALLGAGFDFDLSIGKKYTSRDRPSY